MATENNNSQNQNDNNSDKPNNPPLRDTNTYLEKGQKPDKPKKD